MFSSQLSLRAFKVAFFLTAEVEGTRTNKATMTVKRKIAQMKSAHFVYIRPISLQLQLVLVVHVSLKSLCLSLHPQYATFRLTFVTCLIITCYFDVAVWSSFTAFLFVHAVWFISLFLVLLNVFPAFTAKLGVNVYRVT